MKHPIYRFISILSLALICQVSCGLLFPALNLVSAKETLIEKDDNQDGIIDRKAF
jgi:hypothetical protein